MAYDEIVDFEIDNLGETVTLRVVPTDNYNERGDINESSPHTDTTTKAVPNILGNDDLEVREGRFRNGDKRFFFKTTEENLTNGNRIQHDDNWYEIEDVLKHRLKGSIMGFEVVARKV
ncbi:MAG: hypothetical protein ACOCZ5_00640 [bacterium]